MKAKNLAIFSLVSLIMAVQSMAQLRPIVNSLSKYSAAPGETITINGSNFVANSQVSFGAGLGTSLNFISSTQLEITVPITATYAPVTVTNLDNGLSGSTARAFTMSFGGNTLTADAFDDGADQYILEETGGQSVRYIADVCLCDLNDDGFLDAVSTHQDPDSRHINVMRNQGSNTPSFTQVASVGPDNPVNTGINPGYIECADIDGDGKKDLIVSAQDQRQSNHVKFYRNTFSGGNISIIEDDISGGNGINLPLVSGSNRTASNFRIGDIDGDGKKDLIVGSGNDRSFFIYLNNSTVGDISFSSNPLQTSKSTGTASLLDIGDLDGDGDLDIAVVSSGDPDPISFYKNESTPGNLRLAAPATFDLPSGRNNIKLVDLNNDGLGDLAYTSRLNSRITILENITSESSSGISFDEVETVSFGEALGVEAGDLNGDGKVDLAFTSLNSGLRVLPNTSDGSISFGSSVALTLQLRTSGSLQKPARNIRIADLNADAKPDLAFAFDSQTGVDGEFSIVVNRNCLSPTIAPTDLTFCYDNAFTLKGPKAFASTYLWESANANFVDATAQEVQVTVPGGSPASVDIKLTITSTDGDCSESVTETFTLTNGTPPTAPTINVSPAGTLCSGDEITLSSSVSGDTYLWTLPDGSQVSTAEISIPSAGSDNTGEYTLQVQQAGGCYSNPGTTTLDIDIPPTVNIVNTNESDFFCLGTSVTLEVPTYNGFTMEWIKDGSPTGDTDGSIVASDSGSYVVTVTSAANCETSSEAYEVFAIPEPSAMINANAEICVGVDLDFEATSTGATGFAMSHSWDFKDGSTGTGASVTHSFTTAGTYEVELTSSYDDIDMCEDVITLSINVQDVPAITPDVIGGSSEKCPSDSVRLELPQNFESYNWSTGDTTYFTYAKTTIDQSSIDITADVVTNVGCSLTTELITISNYSNSGITITAANATITNDTLELETGMGTVDLTAAVFNGSNYIWETADPNILSTITGPTTTVFPNRAETLVTVTATDGNSCTESQSVLIIKPGLEPRKTFSPNGDGINDCWEIINSEDQTACTVYVFDSRGRQIYEAESPFAANCVWNGQINGTGGDVPRGIYYFVLKCDDNSSSQSGTILLAR